MEQPLVSVVCESYNHEPFIRRCLEGIMMQQTNFSFEVLVHDDASTDGSQAIIREFEALYPDIVKPIYQTENQYSKGISIWANIQFPRAKGKYIALCEGDDYWTNLHKLQKQVDYMETHPECSLCFHNAITHWHDGSKEDSLFANVEDRDYSGIELTETWYSPTASFVFRRTVSEGFSVMENKYPLMKVGDMPLIVQCAKEGIIHGFSDIMSVYTKHDGGWSHFTDANKTYIDGISFEERRKAFGPEYYKRMTDLMTGFYLNAMIRAIRERNLGLACKAFYRAILRQPVTGIRACMRIPQERKARLTKE